MGASLEQYVNPHVLSDENRPRIRNALRAGQLVIIHDAVKPGLADSVYSAIDACDAWLPYEGASPDFHFHHHNLYNRAAYPPPLLLTTSIFSSDDTKSLLSDLTGRECSGRVGCSASWYMPGDYSLPHDDCSSEPPFRQVAYIWHLTRDWDARWGGHLYWGPTQEMLRPSFNTLYLFVITPRRQHFVAPVANAAVGKRLTVNGWWYGDPAYPNVPAIDESEGVLTVTPA